MTDLVLFLVMLKDAALSLGGLGSLPLIRQDLVATGVATDAQVVQALAIGRLSPGPNGMWLVSLGYQIAGWTGAVIALVASCAPPLVMIPATMAARRWLLTQAFAGIVRGASLATAGLLCATAVSLVVPNGEAVAWWQFGIAAVATVLTVEGRVHPAFIVLGGAMLGAALGR